MPSFEVTGGAQFHVVAMKMRNAAHGDLEREILQALEKASVPLRADAKRSALENLPKRGGLNVLVADSIMTVQRRAGGIRVVAKGMTQLAKTNNGEVRHPVYGNRNAWTTQDIPLAKDWFFKPFHDGKGKISRELRLALDDVARKIA
jgi:hypothetical protein